MAFPKHVSDFDTLAGEYERFRSSYSDALFNAIVEFAGPLRGRRVLDVACCTGLSTRGLLARGMAVTGVDIAANMLDAARRMVPEAAYYVARAEALPFADEAFPRVTCGQAFHWFDAQKVLAEIERVLVPAGAHAQYWKDALPADRLPKPPMISSESGPNATPRIWPGNCGAAYQRFGRRRPSSIEKSGYSMCRCPSPSKPSSAITARARRCAWRLENGATSIS